MQIVTVRKLEYPYQYQKEKLQDKKKLLMIEIFYNDKNVNMSGRYIIMKKYTPKSRASKIHEAKLTEIDNLVK